MRVYQPQIESWSDQRVLVARAAFTYEVAGDRAPVPGTMRLEAQTTVALGEGLVRLDRVAITELKVAGPSRERSRTVARALEAGLAAVGRVIALDRVLAGVDTSRLRPRNVEGVRADSPRVFVSASPAILIGFDGAPIWSPIPGSDLKYAVNTNWDVFEHEATRTIYLRHDRTWLQAPAVAGPWTRATALPPSFSWLPADENWAAVKASLAGRHRGAPQPPVVFVSTTPSELIVTQGPPSYLAVGTSRLLWVHNTDSDLFRLGLAGPLYYLVAGRWFSAPGFDGPWTFATPTLPPEFARIPIEHPRSRVLAAVPGTPQAAEAVLLASLPQTARVDVRTIRAPVVHYAGEPVFEAIDGTTVRRAVNTDKDIVQIEGLYYLCFQGVWFVSSTPQGPWEVARTLPSAVSTIPISSPIHHVTYVTVIDSDSETVIFSTTAGYTGVTVSWGCAVWGTGWYYTPYVWYGGAYPVYYPYAPTYGVAAAYNPWTATYQRGAVAYGPYGGAGAAARYNASTGTYARGAVAWGPYGAEAVGQAYNPRTGTYAQIRQGGNVYGSWGTTAVQRGDDWAQTARVSNHVTGETARVTRTDEGAVVSRRGPDGGSFVAAGEEGLYAGRDGHVYRRGDDGGWQKYEDGAWGAVERPARAEASARDRAAATGEPPTIRQLDQDRAARADGATRARDRQSVRGGERPNPGSYRPSRPSGRRAPARRR